MAYMLEQLGDERFQQLCQAILVSQFPNVQCLPVNQPDGGRDAFMRYRKTSSSSALIVYQVKFVRNPDSREARDFVEQVVKSEIAKVEVLKLRGASLVSRVQGTFEFEVQPLREYFAARYLYDTAPYSPSGAQRRGTLPDRFDAIARNFYWLNVTRFYAGCYSSGELASLLSGLEDLEASEQFRHYNLYIPI